MGKVVLLFFLGWISWLVVPCQEVWASELSKRVGIDAKLSLKSKPGHRGINDVRQEIGGYFRLQDQSPVNSEAIGSVRGKYWIIGQAVGGWASGGTGKYIVFQKGDWTADLPQNGSTQIDIKETATLFDKTGSARFGYEYFGYVYVIQGKDEAILLAKTNRKEFEKDYSAFLKLEEKITFDKDLSPKEQGYWYQ